MASVLGGPFDKTAFISARGVLRKEFAMPDDVPGVQPQYRLTLACSFLHRFYLHCAAELRKDVAEAAEGSTRRYPPAPTIASDEECGADGGGGGSWAHPNPASGVRSATPLPRSPWDWR